MPSTAAIAVPARIASSGVSPQTLAAWAADIAGPAEEQRVAEGQEPDIADQKVERAGEQCEAQRLHQKDRVGEERRDDQNAATITRKAMASLRA